MLFFSMFYWSCQKEQMADCFMPTGKIITEHRVLSAFTKIDLSDRIKLNYKYSSNYYAEVEAGKNLLKGVSTNIKNGTLEIKNNNRCNWVRSFEHHITVTLYAPDFNYFTYRGSGEVNFIDTLKANDFSLELWNASGDMFLKIKADYISLKSHTAPGVIIAEGECRELYCYLGGNGKIDTKDLESSIATAINKNTGNIFIQCHDNLKAEIEGSGNIEYIGSPIVDFKKSGSGNLIKRD